MTTRNDIIAEARKYLGVRFHHQGRTAAGLDCAGLITRVGNDLRLLNFDTVDYGHLPNGGEMQALCNRYLNRRYDVASGAVLLLKFDNEPQHLAIATSTNSVIHALMEARKVVEHVIDAAWYLRIVAIYDYPGVIDG